MCRGRRVWLLLGAECPTDSLPLHTAPILAGTLAGSAVAWWRRREDDDTPAVKPAAAAAPAAALPPPSTPPSDDDDDARPTIYNWSGTHAARPSTLATPESLAELEEVVAKAHAANTRLRPAGSALSPNGLALDDGGMVSLALMDAVLAVDVEKRTVTAQAGARVADITAALRSHNLTLPVYASIKEQTLGGYIQAGAHGTGARIPPADAALRGLTLVTPGKGTLRLSSEGTPDDPDASLFRLAAVGLGSLGVVADVTLACDPRTWLVETTKVVTRAEAAASRPSLLATHRHVRFMWLPHTDAVVVVALDAAEEGTPPPVPPPSEAAGAAARGHLEALVPAALVRRGGKPTDPPPAHLAGLSPMLLRQWLLSSAPLDVDWVATVNAAEAEFWRGAAGGRAGWSDELLRFDCAGAQWVLEVALPTGSVDKPTDADARFMADLLAAVETGRVPAPAPIEQRWTAASPSSLSPASPLPGDPSTLFSWVGVIMYLPDEGAPTSVADVSAAFDGYAGLVEKEIGPRYSATEHWAKIEPRRLDVAAKRAALEMRFPTAAFAAARAELDPRNVLGGGVVDAVLPHPLVSRK